MGDGTSGRRELPGHIRKAFRSIERFLPVVDLVIELLDARMPLSSRLPGLTQRLGKASVVVLGKADLADEAETNRWLERFSKAGETSAALDARHPEMVKQLGAAIRTALTKVRDRDAGAVHEPPLPARRVSGRKGTPRLLVIGIPNVGKSTLINALAGRRAARVANIPGVTRDIQWVKIPGKMELLDLPGILDYRLLKMGETLRLINTIPGPTEEPEVSARHLCRLLDLRGLGCILPNFHDAESGFVSFLEDYAGRMHFLAPGGVPDKRRAAVDLVRRFQSAGFGRVTLEPADIAWEAPAFA